MRLTGRYLGLILLASIAIVLTSITIRVPVVPIITGIGITIALVSLNRGASSRFRCIGRPWGVFRFWCALRAAARWHRINISMVLVGG